MTLDLARLRAMAQGVMQHERPDGTNTHALLLTGKDLHELLDRLEKAEQVCREVEHRINEKYYSR